MINLLGIDYGRRHTGLAVATTPLAEPVTTVPTREALNHITCLIDEHHIQAIIIGLPEKNMAQEVKTFTKRLQRLRLPMVFQDETLTSLETRRQLAEAEVKRSTREAKIDHLVAARILQNFIDTYQPLNSLADLPKPATIEKSS